MTPIPWTEPSPGTLAVFLAIVAAVILAFLAAVAHAAPTAQRARHTVLATSAMAIWLTVHAGVGPYSLSLVPVSLFAYFFATNGTAVALAFSPLGRHLARHTPLPALLAFPLFRLPLEVILHRWYEQGVIPVSMTWSGQNLDVISGLLAPVWALVAWRWPARAHVVGWVGNTVGFVLLLNVARVAVLSSPGPQRMFGDPPLALAAHVPTVWIVAICVAGALFGHLVTYRKLWTGPVAP